MGRLSRRLACCTKNRQVSIDFHDHRFLHERIITYNGLENCILNSHFYRNEIGTSRENAFATDFLGEDDTSCSSFKDASGSFTKWIMKDGQETDEWDIPGSPQQFYTREKSAYAFQFADVEAMKETFAKILLGEDVTGGQKGVTTARALSNAITNLSASIFGELWKLEPLQEEKKIKWRKEMDWLLSPANFMIELVPAKKSGTNGRTFEIMTPKARSDVHMNLPALQKLDSMLIEVLDSMVNTEFWYTEGSSHGDECGGCGRPSRRWWLPYPHVPKGGLSENARKKLLSQGNVIHQVFKAAKSINEGVLNEMLVPEIIKDALPKSVKANLGEELYKALLINQSSSTGILKSLKLKSEHEALDVINKLEAAALAWRKRDKDQVHSKSPVRTAWPFMKDTVSEVDKMESLLFRAEALLQQLKMRYPDLPHSFLNVTKIQYGEDVGHSILEAYSRALGKLAYSILSRVDDILCEDRSSNPNSPLAKCCFPGLSFRGISDTRAVSSIIDKMDRVDQYSSDSNSSRIDSEIFSPSEAKTSSASDTPSGSCIWCISTDSGSRRVSP
ncbi:hypothetical protein Nepgr_028514 [Nepenthes gracilis]|uniref:PRONE domain-containing protein n=1 Tax=Nepenthes gracilis TaxID=150966 RepID=A0AAD3Y4M2_NEPGR|nr:hypothetical protein Nepgr_028514 [Nepenthes gracilis]